MKRVILMLCLLVLSVALYAQGNSRVRSGTLLRWGMNGSTEVMEGDLAYYYGNRDTTSNYKRNLLPVSAGAGGNPHANRFTSVQALCDQSAVLLKWVAVQQSGADWYDIEQSTDGQNWANIGTVPANRTDIGEASYNFNVTKNTGNSLFRITSSSTTGERVYSTVIESPCSNNAYLALTPNPVYSTTTLRIGAASATKIKLMLVNNGGTVVQTKDASLLAGSNQVRLDMSVLQKGYYTLFIQWTNGRQEALNLVKQ